FLLVVMALIALASNSLFCRLALGQNTIDPAGFTIVRLLSGAVALAIFLLAFRRRADFGPDQAKGGWLSAAMLFLYAIAFSYAYLFMDAGTGALILFGTTQITILMLAHMGGTRLHMIEWLGVAV